MVAAMAAMKATFRAASCSCLGAHWCCGVSAFPTWVISHVPMFHITQPLDSMIGIWGLLDGYYFWWCPIYPKSIKMGHLPTPVRSFQNLWTKKENFYNSTSSPSPSHHITSPSCCLLKPKESNLEICRGQTGGLGLAALAHLPHSRLDTWPFWPFTSGALRFFDPMIPWFNGILVYIGDVNPEFINPGYTAVY